MTIGRLEFFSVVRNVICGGKISQQQVEGFETLLGEYEKRNELSTEMFPKAMFAYMLATTWHETARTMQPVAEYGKGTGYAYGLPDLVTGHSYYGRGYVQLTWKKNYEKVSTELNVNFIDYPDNAMQPHHAVRILFDGMLQGWFTGKKLKNYFNERNVDYFNARKIINALDRAAQIAAYAAAFREALG